MPKKKKEQPMKDTTKKTGKKSKSAVKPLASIQMKIAIVLILFVTIAVAIAVYVNYNYLTELSEETLISYTEDSLFEIAQAQEVT